MSSNRRTTRSSTRKLGKLSETPSNSSHSTRSKRQSQTRIDESLKPSKTSRKTGGRKAGTITKAAKAGGFEIVDLEDGNEIQVEKVQCPAASSSGSKVNLIKGYKKELSKEEEERILKDFDLDCLFGACRGISRTERYDRAIRYQLKPVPSPTVKHILDAHKGDRNYESCIWDQNDLLRIRTPRS